MKIEITWNRSDGSKAIFGFAVNDADPYENDEEMQKYKAIAGAQAHFHQEFGEAPPLNQLTTVVLKD